MSATESARLPGSPRRPLSHVLVKPAGPDCNLRCDYCFYTRKSSLFPGHPRMSDEVLSTLTRKVLMHGPEQVTFVWQGGEPTLMGLAFYERALMWQQRYRREGQTVENALMTNGLLLDRRWADLLRRGRFLVGLSLDGPRELHDLHRRRLGGQPTWDRVVRAARLLLDQGVLVNAVVLATAQSTGQGQAIYGTLKDLGFSHLQVVPCVETVVRSDGKRVLAPVAVTTEGYAGLLLDLFQRWSLDFKGGVPTISVRWLDSILQQVVGLPASECTQVPVCGAYLVVEHDGSVYPCDFYVEPERRVGHVLTDDPTDLLNSDAQRAFGLAKAALAPECLACDWVGLCHGGCPKDRLLSPLPDRTWLCEAYRRFFKRAMPGFQALARAWRQSRQRPAPAPVGRNDPCPCGSGRKYKRCCGLRQTGR